MKKIAIVLIILILILLALIFYQKSKETDEDGIKVIYKNQETSLSYTKIRSNENVSFSTERGDKYNGFDLTSILESLNIPTDIETKYTFHSKDGGTLSLSKKEDDIFYLVFQEGSDGQSIRLVIPSDEFSQRWIKYIVAMEIE